MVWSREERSLAAGLVVLALAGAGWLLAGRLAGAGPAPELPVTEAVAGEDEAAPSPEPAPPLLVHVAGAVRDPGVYELPAGARVIDALTAAGGPTEGAAVDAVNLAAAVSDGARLYIPTLEEIEAAGPLADVPWPAGAAGVPGWPAGDAGSRLVAVNRAGPEELQRLPGIGPVLAERIVAYRRRNGPFQAVEDLLGVSGIGPKVLEQLRPYVVVP